MDRRKFLNQVARWSAGTVLAAPVLRITPRLLAEERPSSRVVMAKGSEFATLVKSALAPLGGMEAFVKAGDHVVVKPNIGWDRRPEQAANTHPEVVKAVVAQALAAGARQVQVFDRTCNEQRRCYASSGIQAALAGMPRVRCQYVDSRRFVPVDISLGRSLHRWSFYRDALQADCYINLPVAKHHGLAGLTLGLKNIMGVIGGNRGEIHHGLGPNLADLNTVIRPALTLVDATRILLRNGPSGGKLEDVEILDTLVASRDIVAADAVATTLFGRRPEEIPATRAAAHLGLGEMDLSRIDLVQV